MGKAEHQNCRLRTNNQKFVFVIKHTIHHCHFAFTSSQHQMSNMLCITWQPLTVVGCSACYCHRSTAGVMWITNSHKNTVRCSYNAVFLKIKILIIDTPLLAREGELWGVCCEFEVWFKFCFCPHSGVGDIKLIWTTSFECIQWMSDRFRFYWNNKVR